MKNRFWVMAAVCAAAAGWAMSAYAGIRTQDVEYRDGATVLEGYLAYDDAVQGRRPAVLVIHEWMGLGPYEKQRAEQIAGLGYVGFCVDMYGKGVRPKTTEEAARMSSTYRADRRLMRMRAQAALSQVSKYDFVDTGRIAAMGYCFGGGTALELARSGAALSGVVSFHGNLDTPHPEDAGNIKGKVLVLHGADDPVVPAASVAAFQDEMRKAKVDWQMNVYGNAVHRFSNPGAGNDASKGLAYNEEADKRSWEAMQAFFREIFAR